MRSAAAPDDPFFDDLQFEGRVIGGRPVEAEAVPSELAPVHSEQARLEVVRQAVTTASTMAHERTLPVAEGLAALVPSGQVQRGSSLSVHGVGATSFALALAGQAVRDGSFMAVVAPSSFGLAACLDFDIPLRRVVQFVLPDETAHWAPAVAAIIEGFDVVVLADQHRVTSSQARQLTARTRERGAVLVRVGGPSWSNAADLRFDVTAPDWSGLGQGHGHLRSRQVAVQVTGRRYHGRQGPQPILLPAASGGVAAVESAAIQPVPIRTLTPQSTAPQSVVEKSAAEKPEANERFAGADIDAFLAAIDAADADGDTPDLDAIA